MFFITPNGALFGGCKCYLTALEFLIQVLYLFYSEANLRFQKNENNLRYLSFGWFKLPSVFHIFCLGMMLLLGKILPHLNNDIHLVVTFMIWF